MKKVYVPDGWDEITTSRVRVRFKVNRVFLTAEQWTSFGKKEPKMYHGNRHHCQRCDVKWEDLAPDAPTFLVPTTKGNKVLCEKCFNTIQPSAT